MERIHVNLNIPPEVEVFDGKQRKALLASTFIKEYLKQNQMINDDVIENVPFFLQLVEEIKECKSCSGLASCVKKERGYVPTLKKIGFVQWVKTPCRYAKDEWKEKEKLNYYRYKSLPLQWLDVNFSSIDPLQESIDYQNVFQQVVKWAGHPQGKGFYLHGVPGVGKTYLMLCLLNKLVLDGKTVAFVNVLELIAANKPRLDFDAIHEIIAADFVVLDDIGAEAVNTVSRDEILFSILDARMNSKRATCFTSNFSMSDLEQHFTKSQYGDVEPVKALRIMERIKALAKEVEMHGKSRR